MLLLELVTGSVGPKVYGSDLINCLATTSPESRQVWKTSDSSVNWIRDYGSEIINGSTGLKNISEQGLALIFEGEGDTKV